MVKLGLPTIDQTIKFVLEIIRPENFNFVIYFIIINLPIFKATQGSISCRKN